MKIIKCPYCGKWERKGSIVEHLDAFHFDILDVSNVKEDKLLESWKNIGILETNETKQEL